MGPGFESQRNHEKKDHSDVVFFILTYPDGTHQTNLGSTPKVVEAGLNL